jgi:hypothetical protein
MPIVAFNSIPVTNEKGTSEVFSPGIRTELKGTVGVAGQASASRQRLPARALGAGAMAGWTAYR